MNKWNKDVCIPSVGVEPTIFGLEVQRGIHFAKRACKQTKINICKLSKQHITYNLYIL